MGQWSGLTVKRRYYSGYETFSTILSHDYASIDVSVFTKQSVATASTPVVRHKIRFQRR